MEFFNVECENLIAASKKVYRLYYRAAVAKSKGNLEKAEKLTNRAEKQLVKEGF